MFLSVIGAFCLAFGLLYVYQLHLRYKKEGTSLKANLKKTVAEWKEKPWKERFSSLAGKPIKWASPSPGPSASKRMPRFATKRFNLRTRGSGKEAEVAMPAKYASIAIPSTSSQPPPPEPLAGAAVIGLASAQMPV